VNNNLALNPTGIQQWLRRRPKASDKERENTRRAAVALAYRAAMRVLPLYWQSSTNHKLHRSKQDIAFDAYIPIGLVIASMRALASATALRTSSRVAANTYPAIRNDATEAFFFSSLIASADFDELDGTELEHLLAISAATVAWTHSTRWAIAPAQADIVALDQGLPLIASRLWPGENPLTDVWAETRKNMLAQGPGWKFWVDWYDKALRGDPQDWDLLTKVALIDPDDWDKGADHVNALIQQIIEQHTLAIEARRLKAENERLVEQLRVLAQRSHNNPPELVDDAPTPETLTVIWAHLDEAQRELDKPNPMPSRLVRIAGLLKKAALVIGALILLPIGTAMGDFCVKLIAHNESIIAFADTLMNFARTLGN